MTVLTGVSSNEVINVDLSHLVLIKGVSVEELLMCIII